MRSPEKRVSQEIFSILQKDCWIKGNQFSKIIEKGIRYFIDNIGIGFIHLWRNKSQAESVSILISFSGSKEPEIELFILK